MLDATVEVVRRALGAAEGCCRRAGDAAGRLGLWAPRLPELLTRLPLVGTVGGGLTAHAPALFEEGGARRSMSRAATVTRIVVDEQAGAPGRVGALVKRKFFEDYPPFVFNVCFSCGRDGRYCDPRSIWFNVFLGYYEIVAPKSLWRRPFGYVAAGGQAAIRFEDVVRIGKADWNYFSNYLYGVPARLVEPYDRIEMDKVKCRNLGRERIAAEGDGGAGRYWDVAELDGVEVVSAYVSGRDGHRLESPSRLSPLWRLAFGGQNPRPDYPVSFVPTLMRARLYMSHGEGRHPRLGEVYRTVIFGGTVNRSYRDAEENGRFLDEQAEALRQVIGRHYPHLGFASHRDEEFVEGRRVA